MVATRRNDYSSNSQCKRKQDTFIVSNIMNSQTLSGYNFVDLPEEILRIIFHFLNFDTIANLRLVRVANFTK